MTLSGYSPFSSPAISWLPISPPEIHLILSKKPSGLACLTHDTKCGPHRPEITPSQPAAMTCGMNGLKSVAPSFGFSVSGSRGAEDVRVQLARRHADGVWDGRDGGDLRLSGGRRHAQARRRGEA